MHQSLGKGSSVSPDAVEYCRRHDITVIAGYSMGGRLALRVALAHPERVERLVLVGTTPGIADDVERGARREADEALASELEDGLDLEAFARRWAKLSLG